MRVLTNEDVIRLEQAVLPSDARALSWDSPDLISDDLENRGLVTHSLEIEVGEDYDTHWRISWLTARGQLALRVHRAYLASIGASA